MLCGLSAETRLCTSTSRCCRQMPARVEMRILTGGADGEVNGCELLRACDGEQMACRLLPVWLRLVVSFHIHFNFQHLIAQPKAERLLDLSRCSAGSLSAAQLHHHQHQSPPSNRISSRVECCMLLRSLNRTSCFMAMCG